jgi:flagellar hook-basal body complex protein FliE
VSIETIRSIDSSGIESIEGLTSRAQAPAGAAPTASSPATTFADMLGQAIGSVDKMQLEADDQATKVANGGGNLHEMSLALEKADISMRVAVKVRNKLLDAYNDIMKMGV